MSKKEDTILYIERYIRIVDNDTLIQIKNMIDSFVDNIKKVNNDTKKKQKNSDIVFE